MVVGVEAEETAVGKATGGRVSDEGTCGEHARDSCGTDTLTDWPVFRPLATSAGSC